MSLNHQFPAPSADIVLFGGGSGGSVMAGGLVEAFPDSPLAVVVPMGDNGGSTGKLREFSGVAIGDLGKVFCAVSGAIAVRNVLERPRFDASSGLDDIARLNDQMLAALPAGVDTNRAAAILEGAVGVGRELQSRLGGLKGHTYRNLALTALQLYNGGNIMASAYEFGVWVSARAHVIPATAEPHDVVLIDQSSGGHKEIRGEDVIDNYAVAEPDRATIRLDLGPGQRAPDASKEACYAMAGARVAIIGPGSPLTSLAPSILPTGFQTAFNDLQKWGGQVVAVANLYPEQQATPGLTLDGFVHFIGRHGVRPDYVLYNTDALPGGRVPLTLRHDSMLPEYAVAIGASLVDTKISKSDPNDAIAGLRSDIHHSPQKVTAALSRHIPMLSVA